MNSSNYKTERFLKEERNKLNGWWVPLFLSFTFFISFLIYPEYFSLLVLGIYFITYSTFLLVLKVLLPFSYRKVGAEKLDISSRYQKLSLLTFRYVLPITFIIPLISMNMLITTLTGNELYGIGASIVIISSVGYGFLVSKRNAEPTK